MIVGHTARLVGHHHLFVNTHIVDNWLSSRSCRGSKLNLDLGEAQAWELEDSLFTKVLKPVPIVTPYFIEIGLGYLVLFYGLLLHDFHVLMECIHFKLQMGILLH